MQWEKWSERAKKPATITATGLMLIGLCMITGWTNVIMHASVALFTAGIVGLTEHKRQNNRR